MTRNIPARAAVKNKFALYMSTITLMFFMTIGLAIAASSLSYAVNFKLDNSEITDLSKVITTEVREKQLKCLARNIYNEASGEPFEGKVAIAQVTLNRAKSGEFPTDICDVVHQKNVVYNKILCQFSWYCNKPSTTKPLNKEAYEESMTVAKKVLLEDFELPSLTDAMYFHSTKVKPGWKREKITTIGQHIFYK